MEIRYKYIQDERTEDAPFVGALISAIGCKNNCDGCFNRHVKDYPTLTDTAEDIVEAVLSNEFNEGIILGGLEWSEQPMELVELCRVASEKGLKVMIYTGCDTIKEFFGIIGKACATDTGYSSMIDAFSMVDADEKVYSFIGALVLNNIITDEFYVKVGRYEIENTVGDLVHFGVRLASDNQRIYKIEKEEEDEGKTE